MDHQPGWPKWFYNPGKGTEGALICGSQTDVPLGWEEAPTTAPDGAATAEQPRGVDPVTSAADAQKIADGLAKLTDLERAVAAQGEALEATTAERDSLLVERDALRDANEAMAARLRELGEIVEEEQPEAPVKEAETKVAAPRSKKKAAKVDA